MIESTHRREKLWSRPPDLRFFTTTREAPRSRRPTDLLLLVVCVLLLAFIGWVSNPPSGFEVRFTKVLTSLPSSLNVVWRAGMGTLTVWAIFLLAATLVRVRLDVLRDQILAVAGSVVGVVVMYRVVGESARSLWDSVFALGPPPDQISLRVAVAVAAVAATMPHATRPFRVASRWLVACGAISAVIGAESTISGMLIGLLCGLAAAAAVHLALGSCGGTPSVEGVRQGLADLGVELESLSEAQSQRSGVFEFRGADRQSQHLVIRVYGRDAWDAQLMVKAWRALWYRDTGSLSLTRLQQVEHEAFVTLLAAGKGVPTQDVVCAGRTADNDALIVLLVRGECLADKCAPVDPSLIEAVWDSVLDLSDAGFAHGDLAPANLRFDGSHVVIDGLGRAVVATSEDQRLVDLAQAITLTALLVPVDEAVMAAQRHLDAEEFTRVIPYLQAPGLGPRLRSAVGTAHLDIDELRAKTASAAGVDPPQIAKLRRVSARSLVTLGLLIAVAYFLITVLSGVDIHLVGEALRSAYLPVMLMALIVGQLPRLTQAESTRGACPRPLAYGPVVLLQFAMTFIGLVVPSNVARVALSVRFFQKQGFSSATALSIGMVDTVAGVLTQAVILVAVLLFGLGEVNLNWSNATGSGNGKIVWLLLAIVVILVMAVVVMVAVPKARARVVERVRPWASDAHETLGNLRSPSKVVRILLANLATELLFASSLALVLLSLGSPLPLAEVLVINVTVSLFAGVIPVPGGIGVYEAAFVVALTAAGLDESKAFAAAICFRLCTYYLPPIWGWFAFHRLERTGLI